MALPLVDLRDAPDEVARGIPWAQLWAPEGGSFSAAVAYHAVTLGGHTWHSSTLTLPLLFGVGSRGGTHGGLGPRAARTAWWGESQRTLWLWHVGGSLGVIVPVLCLL